MHSNYAVHTQCLNALTKSKSIADKNGAREQTLNLKFPQVLTNS